MLRPLRFLILMLAALAACSSGDAAADLEPPVRSTTVQKGHVRTIYKVRLQMQVEGAETLDMDTETQIDVTEIMDEDIPRQVWFLSIAVGEASLRTPDGRGLAYSIDVAPGTYKGPGVYEVTTEPGPPVDGVQPNIGGGGYVQFVTLTATPSVARYDQLLEPCTLVFEDDAARGTVTCPKLGQKDGEGVVSLQWQWNRLERRG